LTDLGHAHSIHSVNADKAVSYWDNALDPILEVESGATVEIETMDASGGQLGADSTVDEVSTLDMTRVNPVTGPIYVKSAQPGDVLAVEIRDFKAKNWGWTAIIPGFGLLADEFPAPWLNISDVDPQTGQVQFADGVTLPYAPFPGTIGLAPPEPGQHSVIPPRKWGGNMDIKHLRTGTTLFLPVAVEGALLSVGDTHATMGDGEVCGTAVETTMDIAVRLTVRKDMSIAFPQFHIPQGQLANQEQSSYHVCTGVHEDLMEAAREATRGAVKTIVERYEHSEQEAYAIASVAGDLRIHEIVDAPNWVVGLFIPEAIFT
jgi:acetamidase/formamidase